MSETAPNPGKFAQTMMSESPLSRMQLWLMDHLPEEDLLAANDLLDALVADFSNTPETMAADAARRQVAARQQLRASAGFDARFPGAVLPRLL